MFRFIFGVFLKWWVAFMIIILSAIMVVLFHWHPMFKVSSSGTLAGLLAESPLEMTYVPFEFRRILKDAPAMATCIHDTWGFCYPPFAIDTIILSSFQKQALYINRSTDLLKKNKPKEALEILENYYNYYPPVVACSPNNGAKSEEPVINSATGNYVYALTRYNRAVVLLKQADLFSSAKNERNRFLRCSVYDLKKAVGTLEKKVGYLNSKRIYANIGSFKVHRAYVTLAAAYLKTRNLCYPPNSTSYLKRMRNIYTYSEQGISPVVLEYIDLYLNGDVKRSRAIYKLIHALQNLEFCGRKLEHNGISNDHRYNYMVGLILTHLALLSPPDMSAKSYDHAEIYFQRVIDSPGTIDKFGTENKLGWAALKEQTLTDIVRGNAARAIRNLKRINPMEMETVADGPDKLCGLLFCSMAQYGNFSKGAIDEVIDYELHRDSQGAPEKVNQFHTKIMQVLANNFFKSLTKRISRLQDSHTPEIGAALNHFYRKQYQQTNYLKTGQEHLSLPLAIRVNIGLHGNKDQQMVVSVLKWLLPVLLVIYPVVFFKAHRKMAVKVLESRYS